MVSPISMSRGDGVADVVVDAVGDAVVVVSIGDVVGFIGGIVTEPPSVVDVTGCFVGDDEIDVVVVPIVGETAVVSTEGDKDVVVELPVGLAVVLCTGEAVVASVGDAVV